MTPLKAQKALLLLHAEAGKYVVGEAPIPRPGPKDVLVKVMAAALNPMDWKVAIPPAPAFIQEYPFVTGSDGAGVVVEIGEQVTGLKEGDRILFQGFIKNSFATCQQYCIVPAELTARIPEHISFDQAASVPLGLATVVLALYNQQPDYPNTLHVRPIWEENRTTDFAGKPAFIIGGASSVGQYAIQIARLEGFSPIITTASTHNTELLISLGATYVVDRSLSTEETLAKLAELTDGKPLKFIYDAISLPETMSLAYQALAPGGMLAIVLPDVIPAELKKEGDGKRIAYVIGNVHMQETRACGVQMYSKLTEWLEKGIIKPNLVEVLPEGLAGAPAGLERLKNNKVSGRKLIVRPQETP